jgi:hypothetical protein
MRICATRTWSSTTSNDGSSAEPDRAADEIAGEPGIGKTALLE